MKQLKSLHPVEVERGMNGVTIRNSPKWYRDVEVGDKVELIWQALDTWGGMNDVPQGIGIIIDKKVELFYNLKAKDIDHEHEISSRTYSGLLASMRRAYGDDFGEDSVVTILTYRRA